MFNVQRLIQIMFVLLASASGLLLGLGQRDLQLTMIAMVTAVAAFVLNDLLGVIRFNKWIANIAAILVTAYTLSGFFSAGSGRQLILIANLLVYLQAVLLFQKKTPRVCWQVMVLSLLQVVVAAAFNLELQGGLLFIAYMLLAGITMMLLTLYSDSAQIDNKNEFTRRTISRLNFDDGSSQLGPITIFDQSCQSRSTIRRMVRHIGWIGAIGIAFTTVLFLMMPRNEPVWFGPQILPISETGISKKIELEQDDLIRLSGKTVLRVWFHDMNTDEPVLPENEAYIRGMALGSLQIENGNTTWKAPYNRIYDDDYSQVRNEQYFFRRRMRGNQRPTRKSHLLQKYILESTSDPLIYSVAPAVSTSATDGKIEYCRPLSALTRKGDSDEIEYAPFPYELKTAVTKTDTGYRFDDAWPYIPEYGSRSMADNPAEYRWLTEMDKSRYPTLVSTANDIADSTPKNDHYLIAKKMERYFMSEGFSYTLDFRDVQWNEDLDVAEDFFRNKRRGHCEFYATALALMLRSQGIPARVVVGFRGGNTNNVGSYLIVQEQHAHAWVEAYIRPRNCTNEMIQNGEASQGGAWLVLDATPASSQEIQDLFGTAGDALGYAKNLWRDYVLGINGGNDEDAIDLGSDPLANMSRMIDSDWWQEQWASAPVNDPNSIWWYLRIIVPIVFLTVVLFAFSVRGVRSARMRRDGGSPPRSLFLRILGNAISLVSPRLGRYVSGRAAPARIIDFYERFTKVMRRFGLTKQPDQTQLEFAETASLHLSNHPEQPEIEKQLVKIAQFFYRARFGDGDLDKQQRQEIEQTISQLEKNLEQSRSSIS
jgi:transglutaminase-like putative cysteine protease